MDTSTLLRTRDGEDASKVGFVELFFDLVFVFAATQLSHALLDDLTLAGAARTVLLLVAVWWVWVFTTWVTNWVTPNRTPVRLMLFVLMLLGLVMSASIPQAFEGRGLAFAASYAAMQVGRSLFMLWALSGGHARTNHRNFIRITAWLAVSAVFWVWGGFAEGDARWQLWTVALLIELASPALGFHVPGIGRSTTKDWDVSGHHMAERCSLFVIIALGEVILLSGTTFARLEWDAAILTVFITNVIAAIAMWWIYFNVGAERAIHNIAHAEDPGRLARMAYTYLHAPLICALVISAVGTELTLMHPHGHVGMPMALTMLGSTALYLVANMLFKRATGGRWALSHGVGLLATGGLALATGLMSPVTLSVAVAATLIGVAVWESVSLRATH